MTMNALSVTKSLLSEASKYLVHDGEFALEYCIILPRGRFVVNRPNIN